MRVALALALLVAAAAGAATAQPAFFFNYTEFATGLPGLVSNNAELAGTAVRLTRLSGAFSSLWYSQLVLVRGFETVFTFKIDGNVDGQGAQGIVFVIQTSDDGTRAVGSGYESLGYGGRQGIIRSVAIELDCVKNPGVDDAAPINQHVSVHTLGNFANSANETLASRPEWRESGRNYCNNVQHTVRLVYEPTSGLRVYYEDEPGALLDIPSFRLENLISLTDNTAYVGFTASTAEVAGDQDIIKWSYRFLGRGGRNSVATGGGLSAVTAGGQAQFTVIAVDQYSNNMVIGGDKVVAVLVSNNGQVAARPQISDKNNGNYDCTYSTTVSGTFKLNITVNGEDIQGSPFTVRVGTAEISGKYTRLLDSTIPSTEVAGRAISFVLQAYDIYNNKITTGGDAGSIVVNWSGAQAGPLDSSDVRDSGQGKYQIMVVGTIKQSYLLKVVVNGVSQADTEKSILITPAGASPLASYITTGGQMGVPDVTAGVQTTAVLTLVDIYGNKLTVGTASVVVELLPTDGRNTVELENRINGLYYIKLALQTAQIFSLRVLLDGADLAQSPLSVNVIPSTPFTSNCVATGMGLTSAMAGVESEIVVTVHDIFGNAYSKSPPSSFRLSAAISGPETLVVSERDNLDGTISFLYAPTKTGTLSISVTSSGTHVSGSPSRASVVSGTGDPAKSYVTSEYALTFTTAKADRITFFLIQVVDEFGNQGNRGGDEVAVTITNADAESTQPRLVPTVYDGKNGTFSVSFTPTGEQVGTYSMDIVVSGSRIANSPFTLTVLGPDPTNTILWAVLIPSVVVVLAVLVGVYYMRHRKRSEQYMLVEQEPERIVSAGGTSSSAAKYSLMPE